MAAYPKPGVTRKATRVWLRSSLSPSSAPATRCEAASSSSYEYARPSETIAVRLTMEVLWSTHGAHRTGPEGPRIRAEGPARGYPSPVRLQRAARRPLLLPQGRHAGMHEGVVRFSGEPADLQAPQGGGAGHQHPRREEQGELRHQTRA